MTEEGRVSETIALLLALGDIQIWVYRCVLLPSPAGKGDREAVDEESELRFGIGCNFYLHINGFYFHPYENLNPLSSSVTPYGRATFPAGEG